MQRALVIPPLLVALALALSACSPKSLLPSATLVSSTPTPVPPLPTAPPVDQRSTTAFDSGAGNCVEAADEAIKLITDAAAGRFGGSSYYSNYNMDMHLDLEPHGPTSGCADTAHIAHYRQYVVNAATLTVWPLDSGWFNAGPALRSQWLVDVLNTLLKLYPNATINIQVTSTYNGQPCGTATIGAGAGAQRQIDPSCG